MNNCYFSTYLNVVTVHSRMPKMHAIPQLISASLDLTLVLGGATAALFTFVRVY